MDTINKKGRREFFKKSISLSAVLISSGLILGDHKSSKPLNHDQKELARILKTYGSEFGQVKISRKGI